MRLPGWIAAFVALVLMVWLGATSDDWATSYSFKGQKGGTDYYNLLVDGLLDGHLYLKAEVSPEFLSPDPAVRAKAPYLLDASLYGSHYYLYFGVVPAALVFLPYSFLTGHDLSENAAVLFMVALGFALTLRLYQLARRRHFPELPGWWDAVTVMLLAFGPMTPVLLMDAGFYEVAIAGGYLFVSAALLGLYQSLHAESHAGRWLAFASLAFGLAVGCRPTCLLALPILLGAVIFWRHEARTAGATPPESRKLALRLLAAAALPAAVVGLLLMAYNYGRFADPFEFGFKYQVSPLMSTGLPIAKVSFIWPNVGWYYLSPPVLGIFFPFAFALDGSARPANYYGYEPIHGQWLLLLLATLCAAGLLRLWRIRHTMPPPLRAFQFLTLGAFATLFLCLCTFGFRANRYIVDFQGCLVVWLAVAGSQIAAHAWSAGAARRFWRAAFGLLALGCAVFNILVSMQLLDHMANRRPATFARLARYGNIPAAWLARTGWLHYGPVRFKATFHRPATPVYEPLVATGFPGHKDILYVALYPTGSMDFTVYHEDYGGARSAPLPVVWNRPYQVELDMGSLYPPDDQAHSAVWRNVSPEVLKSFTRVALDGVEVLRARQTFYDSPPAWLHLGRAPGRADRVFSGVISDLQRLPPRDTAGLLAFAERGVWQFEIEIPTEASPFGQPLLGSGTKGAGNLLYLQTLPGNNFRLGLDFWGVGASSSPILPHPGPSRHVMEVFVGPQVVKRLGRAAADYDPHALAAAGSLLRVWLDGRLIWSTPLTANQDTYDFVSLGANTQGFSTAGSSYTARLQPLPLSPEEFRALVEKNLAPDRP